MDNVLTTVRGTPIHTRDVLAHLKIQGLFRSAICELIEENVVLLKCGDAGIELDEDEFQRFRERQRAMVGLDDPVKFQAYLRMNGVTYDQWSRRARIAALRSRLKEKVVTEAMVADYYRRHRDRFTSVSVARIVCRGRDEAMAVDDLVRQPCVDFVQAAREHSVETSTRVSGGYIGILRKGLLPANIEEVVFAAGDGQVVGPFPENDLWSIYKVYSRNETELTDAMKTVIKDQIFSEWMRHEVQTVPA